MRVKRAENLSKYFSDFIRDSVAVTQDTWTHHGPQFYEDNGVTKTGITLSYFIEGKCNQRVFDNLDETENFINNYIKSREILFRRFA